MIPHGSTVAINVSRSRSSGRDGYALLSSAHVPFAASFGSMFDGLALHGRTSFRALIRSICRLAPETEGGGEATCASRPHLVKYAI